MTREQMLKVFWRAYQEVYYQHPRSDRPLLCLLIEIDFDEEYLTLQPLFGEDYICKDFTAGIQHCSIPTKKMKAAAIHGVNVNDKKSIAEFQGKSNRMNPYFKYENIDTPDAS